MDGVRLHAEAKTNRRHRRKGTSDGIDPNGNLQEIGKATSDSLGNFAFGWTPPVPGMYTISATFEGSDSYYRSQAGTSFMVSETHAAPEVTPTPTTSPEQTPTPTSGPTETPVQSASPSPSEAPQPGSGGSATTLYIVVAATVIVIVAVAATLVLRRRKKRNKKKQKQPPPSLFF
jgi:hypothetical protein